MALLVFLVWKFRSHFRLRVRIAPLPNTNQVWWRLTITNTDLLWLFGDGFRYHFFHLGGSGILRRRQWWRAFLHESFDFTIHSSFSISFVGNALRSGQLVGRALSVAPGKCQQSRCRGISSTSPGVKSMWTSEVTRFGRLIFCEKGRVC